MSIALLNAAFAVSGITVGEKMVLVVLANEVRDRHVDLCWPSMATIAANASMEERSARRVIKQLAEMGLIHISVKGGRGISNRYRILLDQRATVDQCALGEGPDPESGFIKETRTQSPVLSPAIPDPESGFIKETRTLLVINPDSVSGEPLEPLEEEGGAACSASASPISPTLFRERVLVAAGHDASGMTANGRMLGDATDMLAVNAWTADLGLTEPEILTIISELTARSGPPNNLRYFTPALRRFAAEKARPPLTPEELNNGNADHRGSQTGSPRRGGFGPSGRQGAGQGGYGGGMPGIAARREAARRAAVDVPDREEWREPAQLSDRDGRFGGDRE